MEVTVEISYYPLATNYDLLVDEFIQQLSGNTTIEIKTGTMSSLIIGEYDDVMEALKESMQPFLDKYPSVFNVSIASACNVCKSGN